MNKGQFIRLLGTKRSYLTKQEIKTLRGQALSGDLDGAIVGYNKLMFRLAEEKMRRNK